MMIILQNLLSQTIVLRCSLDPSSRPSENSTPHSPRKFNPQKHVKNLTPLHFVSTSTTRDAGRKFREKLIYLESLRVNPVKALQRNPDFRSTPLSALKSVEKCLSSMGIERSALGRIFDMLPQLLTSDPYTDLYPIFDFLLNDVEIPFHDIRKSIIRCPILLVCSVDGQLRPTFRFLEELGFRGLNKITCQTTLLLVSNVEETLVPKIDYLLGLGFAREEVAEMVLRSPGLLTISIENNYRPKVEYFFKEMKGDLAELKAFPQYFSFSLEAKIKPRHRRLMDKGFSLSLPEMLKVSDGEFSARLIEMQLQLLKRRGCALPMQLVKKTHKGNVAS